MARHSRSPPPRRRRDEYDYRGRHSRDNRSSESHPKRSDSRHGQSEPRAEDRRYDDRRRDNQRRDDRERERGDRERARKGRDYDRHRDEDNRRDRMNSSRRSASPPSRTSYRGSGRRRSRSRSVSGSRSASPVDKGKPNFAPSGLLAAATNTVKASDGTSTILKYNEPPEARKPLLGWRLYVFKGSDQVGERYRLLRYATSNAWLAELLHIHKQSAYLIGRDRLVADIAIDHPSCSKQHAVIQRKSLLDPPIVLAPTLAQIALFMKRMNLEALNLSSSA
jgi:smad nuclear-interacting protein 1